MTNPIAVALFAIILALVGLDFVLQDGEASLFIARKFFDFLDWLAFWR